MKKGYDVLFAFAKACLPIIGAFNHKIKLGAQGRERSWGILSDQVKNTLPKIWVHVASLGEFEQIVPVLEQLNHKDFQIVLTFFSPSGYENKKNTKLAHVVCYLPLDTPAQAHKFIEIVNPSLAIMVKYEFWPNYLNELHRRNVHTILVSGVFREKMAFNSWYGSWMKPYLKAINHFFLQNEDSLTHLKKLGFANATVNGDTRFDRASQLIELDNKVPLFDEFIGAKKCLVLGSSWQEDIAVLLPWLQKNAENQEYKIVIAPHEVDAESVQALQNQLGMNNLLWSALQDSATHDMNSVPVLIVDTIGLLTKAYSYASVAYVGGAMGTKGLHNILEAATFGVPVVIGKNYEKFPEAGKLEDLGGLFSIKSASEATEILDELFTNDFLRDKTGMICEHWINSNTGATREVINYIKSIDEKLVSI
ncbi:MAG: 3-deoxy-D-manno-octulosonic acid transferase [Nonlabens sp.]|nr:3-deoxy-D-manno-octulosonic acid transferase [Nonlabens sp.]